MFGRQLFSGFARPRPWTCHNCQRRQLLKSLGSPISRLASTSATGHLKRKGRRRVVLLAATGTSLGLGTLAFTDDVKHGITAAERTGRVITTLAICINDYRKTLNRKDVKEADHAAILKACHKRCAERTLVVLEKNGSIFIKLGQHLSSLNYLLPSEWCETFIPLQDKCPVSSYESIEEMIRKDTGKEISDLFEDFERLPIGAASLAQVHRATMKDTGQRVAVKVQHPSLDEWAPLDLALTRFTFSMVKRFFPEYDLTWLSSEMEVSLPQELDFQLEGHNAKRARAYFSRVKNVPLIIPNVLWAQRRILVMDFVAGHRTDDLAYLDTHHISRDEVSASLARIFNEMIFGRDAPLHCDPHGGNIAIRHNPGRRAPHNFDIILYDHGLYRDIPLALRRSYAKLWLAVLDADEPRMRHYARDVAGITDAQFPLFASAITGRDYRVVATAGGVAGVPRSIAEKQQISDALGEGLLQQLVQLLGNVPRIMLLILKTNDLTRSLDEGLHTTQGPVRTFLILARYAARTVWEEQVEEVRARGSALWPRNAARLLDAWAGYARVVLKLKVYETWLAVRRMFGLNMAMT